MRFTLAECGYETIVLDLDHIELTEDYEYICGYDAGKIFSSSTDGLVLSLQKIVPGCTLVLFNTALDNRAELIIKPFDGDGIMYRGHGRPDSNLVNSKKTQKRGDYIKLASLDARPDELGTKMWHVVESRGVWGKPYGDG